MEQEKLNKILEIMENTIKLKNLYHEAYHEALQTGTKEMRELMQSLSPNVRQYINKQIGLVTNNKISIEDMTKAFKVFCLNLYPPKK